MGALKKRIGANVRLAARLVIDKYYQESRGKPIEKKTLKMLVKRTEKETVPLIMSALRQHALEGIGSDAVNKDKPRI